MKLNIIELFCGRGQKNPGNKVLTNLTTVQRQSTPRQLADEIRNHLELKYAGDNVPGANCSALENYGALIEHSHSQL